MLALAFPCMSIYMHTVCKWYIYILSLDLHSLSISVYLHACACV